MELSNKIKNKLKQDNHGTLKQDQEQAAIAPMSTVSSPANPAWFPSAWLPPVAPASSPVLIPSETWNARAPPSVVTTKLAPPRAASSPPHAASPPLAASPPPAASSPAVATSNPKVPSPTPATPMITSPSPSTAIHQSAEAMESEDYDDKAVEDEEDEVENDVDDDHAAGSRRSSPAVTAPHSESRPHRRKAAETASFPFFLSITIAHGYGD